MSKEEKLNEYDSEPIAYCAKCYSLKIKHEDIVGTDCCMDCGCSDIEEATIEEWEKKYRERYGHDYVVKTKDLRRHPLWKMSLKRLRNEVYSMQDWREIIYKIYPKFPGGLSRIDSVLLFFDQLSKDKRIDELKTFLIEKQFNKEKITL